MRSSTRNLWASEPRFRLDLLHIGPLPNTRVFFPSIFIDHSLKHINIYRRSLFYILVFICLVVLVDSRNQNISNNYSVENILFCHLTYFLCFCFRWSSIKYSNIKTIIPIQAAISAETQPKRTDTTNTDWPATMDVWKAGCNSTVRNLLSNCFYNNLSHRYKWLK